MLGKAQRAASSAGGLEENAWATAEPAVTALVDAYTKDAYARSTSDVMQDTAVGTALFTTRLCCLQQPAELVRH